MLRELPTEQRYSLHIRRYDRFLTFSTLEDLRQELGSYFTEREKSAGIVDRLTSPMMQNELHGYWTGTESYQDVTVQCEVFYPAFDDDSLMVELSKQRIPLQELIAPKKQALDTQIANAMTEDRSKLSRYERPSPTRLGER